MSLLPKVVFRRTRARLTFNKLYNHDASAYGCDYHGVEIDFNH